MPRGMKRTHYDQFPQPYIEALEQFNRHGSFSIELPWRQAMVARRMFYNLFSLLREESRRFNETHDKLTAYYAEIAKNIAIVMEPSKAPEDAPVKLMLTNNSLIPSWRPIPRDLSLDDEQRAP